MLYHQHRHRKTYFVHVYLMSWYKLFYLCCCCCCLCAVVLALLNMALFWFSWVKCDRYPWHGQLLCVFDLDEVRWTYRRPALQKLISGCSSYAPWPQPPLHSLYWSLLLLPHSISRCHMQETPETSGSCRMSEYISSKVTDPTDCLTLYLSPQTYQPFYDSLNMKALHLDNHFHVMVGD